MEHAMIKNPPISLLGRVRNIFMFAAIIGILTGLLLSTHPTPILSQGVTLLKVDVAVVAKGYRASKLLGSGVVNDKNEKVRTLDDIIIDQKRVLFAVLQVGGFLGIGSRLVAVPYDSLKIDEAGRRIELPGTTREELKNLDEFNQT